MSTTKTETLIPKGCLPYDNGRAQAGDKIVTRDGRKAKYGCTFEEGEYPVSVLVDGERAPYGFTREGKCFIGTKRGEDLFMVAPEPPKPETYKVWVVLFRNGCSTTTDNPVPKNGDIAACVPLPEWNKDGLLSPVADEWKPIIERAAEIIGSQYRNSGVVSTALEWLAGKAAESPRIYSRCPACGNDTLTINKGHLLCTWNECQDPTLIDKGPRVVAQPAPSPATVVEMSDEVIYDQIQTAYAEVGDSHRPSCKAAIAKARELLTQSPQPMPSVQAVIMTLMEHDRVPSNSYVAMAEAIVRLFTNATAPQGKRPPAEELGEKLRGIYGDFIGAYEDAKYRWINVAQAALDAIPATEPMKELTDAEYLKVAGKVSEVWGDDIKQVSLKTVEQYKQSVRVARGL